MARNQLLTGPAAVEAVQAMFFLGNRDVRFNGPQVVTAIRRRQARLVIAGTTLGRGVIARNRLMRFRVPSVPRRSSRRTRRLTTPPGRSDGPRPSKPATPTWRRH